MSLAPGRKLAHYEILEPIGKGGMGEVYRARDTKLGRDVAIKVLPEEFARDRERLERFEREARLLAQLNHANIATLHGLEQHDGQQFLVMELVEGETLAERIARGPIPVDEAIQLFIQIAEGLRAAHEKGIIHRDLKPSNIKIDPEGKVKILDFGLAKAFSTEGDVSAETSQSPTLTKGTALGAIMGTASYMSPEQARGMPVDRRTDIWAFGCVFSEALTGRKVFDGATATDIIAAVVRAEPDWTALPPELPAGARRLLERCVRKEPSRRLHHMGDAVLELADTSSEPDLVNRLAQTPNASVRRWRIATLGASALAVVLAGVWLVSSLRPSSPQPIQRWTIPFPDGLRAPARTGIVLDVSPDGSSIVFVGEEEGGNTRLYIRSMDALDSREIPGTEGGDNPVFSPDGGLLAFRAEDRLKTIPLAGGSSTTIQDVRFSGLDWTEEETLLLGSGARLVTVSPDDGESSVVHRTDDEELDYAWPQMILGGRAALYRQRHLTLDWSIAVVDLETGEERILVENASNPRYVSTGHLLFSQEGAIAAAPFDGERLEIIGTPVPVISDLRVESGGASQFSVSPGGTLIYLPNYVEHAPPADLVLINRRGQSTVLSKAERQYTHPRWSPDGRRIALGIGGAPGNTDVWVQDIDRDTLTRLTFAGSNDYPIWSADGSGLFTASRGTRILSLPADGAGEAVAVSDELMRTPSGEWAYRFPRPTAATNDSVVFRYQSAFAGESNVGSVSIDDGTVTVLLHSPFDERDAAVSPDGRWLAYTSNESGEYEVYVQPLSAEGRRWLISTNGGREPVWSPDGKELFYLETQRMMAVILGSTEAGLDPGRPRELFEWRYSTDAPSYDVAPDGERFVMIRPTEESGTTAPPEIRIAVNWFQELERLVPTDK